MRFRRKNEKTINGTEEKEYKQENEEIINLTQLDAGKAATVLRLQGGRQFVCKLEAMGIVPGTTIIKKSASIFKGPIVIEKGNMQVAIGYDTAKGILVE